METEGAGNLKNSAQGRSALLGFVDHAGLRTPHRSRRPTASGVVVRPLRDWVLWVLSGLGVSFFVVRWSPTWVVAAFAGFYVLCGAAAVLAQATEISDRRDPFVCSRSAVLVWACMPISAAVAGSYHAHEVAILAGMGVVAGVSAHLAPRCDVNALNIAGPILGLVSGFCSVAVGTLSFGIAAIVTAFYFWLSPLTRESSNSQSEVTEQELRISLEDMRHLAFTDQLTQIGNRRAAHQWFERANGGFSVAALIDVDRFKDINDKHGYSVGDAVLVQLARMGQQRLGSGWGVFRVGGDEFLVASTSTGSATDRELQHRQLARLFELPSQVIHEADGKTLDLEISLSGGAACFWGPTHLDSAVAHLAPILRRAKGVDGPVLIGDLVTDVVSDVVSDTVSDVVGDQSPA